MGLLADAAGRLWISSKKGISRFDPRTKTFRNYDVSDGLPSNDFWRSCAEHGRNGELFFCGNGGITTFFPEAIRDDPVRAARRHHELDRLQQTSADRS